jgi:hypothetical protein
LWGCSFRLCSLAWAAIQHSGRSVLPSRYSPTAARPAQTNEHLSFKFQSARIALGPARPIGSARQAPAEGVASTAPEPTGAARRHRAADMAVGAAGPDHCRRAPQPRGSGSGAAVTWGELSVERPA